MKKYIGIVAVLVVIVLGLSYFVGLPMLQVEHRVSINTTTQSYEHWRFKGNIRDNKDIIELINNPGKGRGEARKSFLLSWVPGAESQMVSCEGYSNPWSIGWGSAEEIIGGEYGDVRYVVQYNAPGKTDGWKTVAKPGDINDRLINTNAQKLRFDFKEGLVWEGARDYQDFNFMITPPSDDWVRPGAIKVKFQLQHKAHFFDSFHWKTISKDEAEMLPSGGSLQLKEKDNQYEVGENINLQVTTSFSGQTVGSADKGFFLKLRGPNGNTIDNSQFPMALDDDVQKKVSIDVTEDMFNPDRSSNRYHLELWNTMWEEGQVTTNVVDVLAKAPDEPTLTVNPSTELVIDNSLNIQYKAHVSTETQLPIQWFDTCVFYGKAGKDAEPGGGSSRWITNGWISRNAKKSSGGFYTGSLMVTPEHTGYITILASSSDGSRNSADVQYGLKVVDKEDQGTSNDEYTGDQGNYTGGDVSFWDVITGHGGGEKEDQLPIGILGAVGCIVLFLAFMVVGMYAPIPPEFKILVIVLGAVIASLLYWFFFL